MRPLTLIAFASAATAGPFPDFSPLNLNGLLHSLGGRFAPFTGQIVESYEKPLENAIKRNEYVTRFGTELRLDGNQWAAHGANVYWLGLDENVIPPLGEPFYAPTKASYPTKGRITEAMNVLNVMGAHIIRSQTLGVSVGNPLSVEPELGVFNEAAFDTIDWSVYQAREHGLRILAPLTDNYDYYHGGKYVFLRWAGYNVTFNGYPTEPGTHQFYTNRKIIDAFKDYIRHLLTHRNPYTGLTYAQDPTIFAYETGNELTDKNGGTDVPAEWLDEIASFIKHLAPNKLVVDGTYGINETHLPISTVDIYSDHFYPPSVSKLQKDIAKVGAANKVYIAGEYGWKGDEDDPTYLNDFLGVIENQQNKRKPVITGDLFWSLFGHNVPDCHHYVNHSDGFTMHYGDRQNSDHIDGQIEKIRQHFFKMKRQDPGPVTLPIGK